MAEDFRLLVGTQIKDDTQKQLDKMGVKKIQVTYVTKGDEKLQRVQTQYVDSTGQIITATKELNSAGVQTSKTMSKVSDSYKTVAEKVQVAEKHVKSLGERFFDVTKKVIAFGAVTSIIGLFTKGMYEAVDSVAELDASLTELKKVSDLSGEGLADYTEQAFKMAKDLSTTASNVTDATAQFVQAGYDLGESQGLAKYSIMLQSIADESMDVETATNFLTSTIKSMNMSVSDAEHILNAVNETSNKFSITSNDLSENLAKVAGTANLAGVSYEQLIGLMTSAVSKGSGASKSANALKSVFVKIQQMSTDGSMPKLSKQFDEFGISIEDQNGKIKDAYSLLNELSVAYKEVYSGTNVDEQNKMRTLVEDIGGIYNSSVLNNILSGFSTAIEATSVAMNSAGSAQTEFEKSLDSIAKKAEGIQGAFQELVWGDGGLDELIKLFLDAGTALLTFASSDVGKAIISITALTVAINILTSSSFIGFISGIANVGAQLVGLIGYANGAQVALTSLQATTLAVAPWLAVVGGVFALKEVLDFLIVTTDELETKTLELIDANSKLSEEWGNLDSKTELTATEKERLNLLQAQIDANKILIQQEYDKASISRDESASGVNIGEMFGISQSASEALGVNPEVASTEKVVEAYNTLKDAKGKSLEQDDEYVAKRAELITALSEEGLALLDLRDKGVILSESDLSRLSMIQEITGALSSASQSTDILTESEEDLSTTSSDQATILEELAKSYDAVSTATSDVVSSISELSSAMVEQYENGSIQQDTALKLIDSGYALALSYDEQTGAISINKEAMTALAKAKIECQIADLELLKVDIQTKIKEDARVALESAKSFLVLGKAKSNMLETIAETGVWKRNTELVDEQAGLNAQIKVLESSLKGLGSSLSGVSKSSSSAKDKTDELNDALKEQQEILENQRDDYETVIDTILDKFDEEIDKIEELKDADLDRIDSTIDALKTQRDAEEKLWDDKIDALNKQNDAINEQIKLQQILEAIAKAKSEQVMIMGTNGKFGYGQNESAVVGAEEDLDAYNLEQQQQSAVDSLEQQKNDTLSILDAQIQAWEDYKVSIEANYESQIEAQNLLKQNFEDLTNSFEDNQNNLLVQQLSGIDLEQANWQSRLGNLSNFVNNYNAILAQLGTNNTATSASTTSSSSASTSSSSSSTPSKASKTLTTTPKKTSSYVSTLDRTSGSTKAYASGIDSVPSNQMAIVGDTPELVIGSKANGQLMNLAKGSKVVNNSDTKLLANMVGTLGKFGGLSGITGETVNNSNSNSKTISNTYNITANVADGKGFTEYLSNFSRNMLQESYNN